MKNFRITLKNILRKIYPNINHEDLVKEIFNLIRNKDYKKSLYKEYFSEKDIFLLTYGDSLIKEDEKPLITLNKFLTNYLKNIISTVHILPFYPYSSDDGFSILDYKKVNEKLGNWKNIKDIGKNFKLMFDFVCNHISSQGKWFNRYLAGDKEFKDLAIEIDPNTDLSDVERPRATPLLTRFTKDNGKKVYLWTTFSKDQIDINYKSVNILKKIIEVFLFYIRQDASIIRLDAIGYLWKEIGTKCIHLPQTHYLVKLFHLIYNKIRDNGLLITETNCPHKENISYFGNGYDEAQIVYNFCLSPLIVYTFIQEDATILQKWSTSLKTPSTKTTFLNFTASHDGIGVKPLDGFLSKEKIDKIINQTKKNGGLISYKKNSDNSVSPYELNITYLDILSRKEEKDEKFLIKRFIASQSIPLALPGIPAVYIHSLLGSRNWIEGVKKSGNPRAINREKLNYALINRKLKKTNYFRSKILRKYLDMLKIRKEQPAFHPNAEFKIMGNNKKVFAIKRKCPEQTLYSFTNISSKKVDISDYHYLLQGKLQNLFTKKMIKVDNYIMKPYEIIWLTKNNKR